LPQYHFRSAHEYNLEVLSMTTQGVSRGHAGLNFVSGLVLMLWYRSPSTNQNRAKQIPPNK
jgi:hypothetical protein